MRRSVFLVLLGTLVAGSTVVAAQGYGPGYGPGPGYGFGPRYGGRGLPDWGGVWPGRGGRTGDWRWLDDGWDWDRDVAPGVPRRVPGSGWGRPRDYSGGGPGYGDRGQRQGYGRGPTGRGGGPRQGPLNPSITR